MLQETNLSSISVREAVEDYRYAILNLAKGTQRDYLDKLRVFADWCEANHLSLNSLRITHIRQFEDYLRTDRKDSRRGRVGKPLSQTSLHNYMLALKVFLHWLCKEEDYEDCISRRMVDRIVIPARDQKVVETFSTEQIKALLAACDQTDMLHKAVRNRAIILVLLDTGLRAGELCSLTLDYCFLDPNDAYLKVHGKGNKWREVPLGKKSLAALRRYITRYRHNPSQSVFIGKGEQPLTVRGLQQIIEDLGKAAHIEQVRCSPHTLRHTFAVNFLTETGDIYRLMRLLGHTDITITQIYLRALSNKVARMSNKGTSIVDKLL